MNIQTSASSGLAAATAVDDGPIVVVGASRSGTTMFRSCLNAHSRIHLATETHFFDDLRTRKSIRGRKDLSEAELGHCADYFRAIDDRPYGMKGDPENSPISREDLVAASAAFGTDADAVFEAYCRETARRHGAEVWGEKTPRHVFRIDDIRARFPNARFICMVRDPRAVVASYRDWRNQGGLRRAENNEDYQAAIRAEERRAKLSYNIVIATLLWKAAAKASVTARKRHGDDVVRIVRYEDVVTNPEACVRDVCDWLGFDFQPAMLEIPMHNSSFSSFSAKAGFSREASQRWRKTLSPREIGTIQFIAGSTLRDAGYEEAEASGTTLSALIEFVKLPKALALAIFANRNRMGGFATYAWQRLKAVVGV